MPRWDEPREGASHPGRDRWERGDERSFRRGGPEADDRDYDRYFRDRHRALYDEDRAAFQRRYEDAGAAGYDRSQGGERNGDERHPSPEAESVAYHGQEFGVEGHGYGTGEPAPNPGWGFQRHDPERLRNFDFEDPGVGQSQAGYAASSRSAHAHQFDPDYVRWREEQLRNHERAYEAWRRDQHRQYDEEYRQFRSERRRRLGEEDR